MPKFADFDAQNTGRRAGQNAILSTTVQELLLSVTKFLALYARQSCYNSEIIYTNLFSFSPKLYGYKK